jgi:hypothetical protein
MGMDHLADQINQQVADVSLMDANEAYDWNLLELVMTSMEKVNQCYDKLAGMDPDAKVAMNKLRQRIILAIRVSKKTILKS